MSQRVWGRLPGPKLEQTVDLALELGAETVVVHPPFRWQGLYARGFADHVRELSTATGVTVAVENMYPWRGRKREVQAYLPGWDPTDHPYDAVTLDLSHAAVARQDSLALLDVFGDRLAHVHLADGTDSMKDEHMVPGAAPSRATRSSVSWCAGVGRGRRHRDRDATRPHGRRAV
ncbi:TIM barrel protein [Oerskovia sp. M15]